MLPLIKFIFHTLIRDIIKDTDEPPDEEIHKVRSRWVPSAGASVSVELGCITLPVHGCSPTWKLPKPHPIGILWSLLHIDRINY